MVESAQTTIKTRDHDSIFKYSDANSDVSQVDVEVVTIGEVAIRSSGTEEQVRRRSGLCSDREMLVVGLVCWSTDSIHRSSFVQCKFVFHGIPVQAVTELRACTWHDASMHDPGQVLILCRCKFNGVESTKLRDAVPLCRKT